MTTMDFDKPKLKSKQLSKLENALYFTQRDLETNAQGEITDFQAGRLRNRVVMRVGAFGLVAVFIFVVLGLVPVFTMVTGGSGQGFGMSTFSGPVSSFTGLLMPLLSLVAIAAVGVMVWRSMGLVRDLRERRAESVEGRVQLDLHRSYNGSMHHVGGNHYRMSGGRDQYYVYIGGMRFEVSKAGFLAFKNDDPYIVYYAPHSKMLLSAEWLRDDPFA